MKILVAFPCKSNNPFVKTLVLGLQRLKCDITWNLDEFWINYANYDIIHINWPNALFESWNPTRIEVFFLEQVIRNIKDKKIKLLYTRHNAVPHFSRNENVLKCYQLVEANADAIIHLGDYEIEELSKRLKCKHFIIPHHIYEDIYPNNIDKIEARKLLHISKNRFIILAFGEFRNKEEVEIVLQAYKKLKIKNKYLLAPRLGTGFGFINQPNKFNWMWLRYEKLKFSLRKQNIKLLTEYVSDEKVSIYFSAADVVLIQRKKILNSGNLPLAYYFKKAVVGPNIGNVGKILTQTDNIVFEPNDPNSLVDAINMSLNSCYMRIANNNYDYAIQNWNIEKVSKLYLNVYNEIIASK
jgi:glycosyltransferase involved in cell wall biosynthesis